jgi:hypothetical protein
MSESNGQVNGVQEGQPAKTRKYAPKPGGFKLEATIGGDKYTLIPLKGDPSEVRFVLRVKKTVGKELDTYDVHLDAAGKFGCQCRGFLRFGMCKDGRGCRHIKLLRALLREFGGGGAA